MDQGFLRKLPYLPTDIITNIFSRLPIRTIVTCKCVCKSWFEPVETPEFAKLQFSKSVPGLIVYQDLPSDLFRIFEFKDELELEQHEHRYVPVMKFYRREVISPPRADILIEGSANGFLLLRNKQGRPASLYICNPVTREYFSLPNPEAILYDPCLVLCGFGVIQKTDQYKVVGIFQKRVQDPETGRIKRILKFECRVYTLGTGSWRSVLPDSSLTYDRRSKCAVINNNLHWLVFDLKASLKISCFDLETELFNVFSPPPNESRTFLGDVGVLGDHLCLCDNTSDDKVVIWVMKEYGVEQSWTKEIVMSKLYGRTDEVVYPIKVFKDGDILLLWVEYCSNLVYYSNTTKTTSYVKMSELEGCGDIQARLHISSFLSLKMFGMENVD